MANIKKSSLPAPSKSLPSLSQPQEVSQPTWFDPCGLYKIEYDEIHKILSTSKLKFLSKHVSTSRSFPTASVLWP